MSAAPHIDPVPPPALPAGTTLVLFDGLCGFCDAGVQWLLGHDPGGALRFAPLGGETAQGVAARHPELPANLDSIVLVEVDSDGRERVAWHSRAIVALCARLGYPWRVAAWLRVLPRPLTDLAYRVFARYRYLVWGRKESCRIPTPAERARFLP